MEFYEKLQELRKSHGLTQEELAEMLYVSRTAISKWESGRGYPNIESLKAISKCFSVSIDDLLSSETILTIAEEEGKQKVVRVHSLVFGLLDCGSALLLFLPLFGQREGGIVRGGSLPAMTFAAPYIKAVFFALIALTILSGILLLALQNCHAARWVNGKSKLSIGLSAAGTLIFIAAMQPYAAVFAFGFAVLGLVQLVQRRSLFKVDRSILALGGFYIVVMAMCLLFEEVAINYRPVLIGGNLEASYPSSTTMLALCVLPTAMMQLNGRIRGTAVRRTVLVTLGALTAFMVVGRLISGAHWLTDIIGGVLLSVGLVLVYNAAT